MKNPYAHFSVANNNRGGTGQADMEYGQPMSDDDLHAYLDGEMQDAVAYDQLISTDRSRNIRYYFRRNTGNEKPGRSKVVTSDVAEIVDSLVPALLDQFTSTENVVEFSPRGAEDVESAEQATALCNYVFYAQNSGFLRLYEAMQDGVLEKRGIFKWWWDKSSKVTEEKYELSEPELQMLRQDQDITITEIMPIGMDGQPIDQIDPNMPNDPAQEPLAPPMPPQGAVVMYHVTVRRKTEKGQVRIECVPPEEIKVSSRTRSADIREAPFVCHETPKTRGQLIADGYDPALVYMLPTGDQTGASGYGTVTESGISSEKYERRDTSLVVPGDDSATNIIWVQECYFTADVDGDGHDEMRRVCRVGQYILANEIIDDMCLSSWSPKPMAHEFNGQCPADDAVDIQDQKTAILRQTFDSLYQANTPRWQVAEGRVNLDDLLTAVPGGAVRMDNIGDAQPMIMPFIGQQTFPMIEYMDSWRESITGVTRYNQGLDANSLNKTATGIQLITSMSQMRQRLYARMFAEYALQPLFLGILGLLSKHQMEPLSIRLNNKFIPIDPRVWKTQYDMTVNVGLGTGNKDQQLMHLTQIMQAQMGVMGTPIGPLLVKPKHIYETQSKIAVNAGFKDPGMFWTDPGDTMPPLPPPNPLMLKDQAELQLAQRKEDNRHNERMIELRLEMAKLGMPMQVMQELGMPDPIGLGMPMASSPQVANGAALAPQNPGMPPQMPHPNLQSIM